MFVETQLKQIGYSPRQPGAFKITAHYRHMFKLTDEAEDTLFAKQPFATTPSPQSMDPLECKSAQAFGSEAANRLTQMTLNVQANFENILKYKRARH